MNLKKIKRKFSDSKPKDRRQGKRKMRVKDNKDFDSLKKEVVESAKTRTFVEQGNYESWIGTGKAIYEEFSDDKEAQARIDRIHPEMKKDTRVGWYDNDDVRWTPGATDEFFDKYYDNIEELESDIELNS